MAIPGRILVHAVCCIGQVEAVYGVEQALQHGVVQLGHPCRAMLAGGVGLGWVGKEGGEQCLDGWPPQELF